MPDTLSKDKFDEIGRLHPFPWTEVTYKPHPQRKDVLVTMLDARGIEVPLFAMTAFMQYLTAQLALRQPQPAAQATVPTTPETPQ